MPVHNPPITEKGWHGSETRIKILPSDFMSNDDRTGSGIVSVDVIAGYPYKFKIEHALLEVYAHIVVPVGYKATGIYIGGTETTNRIQAFEVDITGDENIIGLINTGFGAPARYVGTEYALDTEMTANPDNYLLVKVLTATTSDYIYGGYINIEKK